MRLMIEYQFDSDYCVSSSVAIARLAIYRQEQQLWPARLPAAAQQLHRLSSLQLQVSLIVLFVHAYYSLLQSLCCILCVLISKSTTGSTATGPNPPVARTGDATVNNYMHTLIINLVLSGVWCMCPPLKVPTVTLPLGHCPLWIHRVGTEVPIINYVFVSDFDLHLVACE